MLRAHGVIENAEVKGISIEKLDDKGVTTQLARLHLAFEDDGCYFGAYDPETVGHILLLEVLAPARSGSMIDGCSLADAERVVREIAKLHIPWWDNPQLGGLDWLRVPGLGAFDLAWFLSANIEPDVCQVHEIGRLRSTVIPRMVAAVEELDCGSLLI